VLLRRTKEDTVSERLAKTLSSSVSATWLRLRKLVLWELVCRPMYSEGTCSNVTFPTANPIWPDRGRTQVNALISRRLTDHSMAQPMFSRSDQFEHICSLSDSFRSQVEAPNTVTSAHYWAQRNTE
jgi:hypothetical protein